MPKPIQTIAQQYAGFIATAHNPALLDSQTSKTLFHAGFIAALTTLTEDLPELPERDALARLVSLRAEACQFAATVEDHTDQPAAN
jgi:fluoride ion exporter CrcB/FEX